MWRLISLTSLGEEEGDDDDEEEEDEDDDDGEGVEGVCILS